MAKRLTYFREFYALLEPDNLMLARLLPEIMLEKIEFNDEVETYNLLPYVQLFTLMKNRRWILLRVIPLHTLYETSEFICRLAQKIEHVDRMFDESVVHLQSEIYRPYSPSSARWFKRIADFMDSREAPQLYLTHYIFGIHGKFFPRMIGAILNIMNISKNDCILDPFCGSGTMNIESAIRGISSVGTDMQPLFTMITRLKIKSIHWNIDWLRQNIEKLLENIRINLESDNIGERSKHGSSDEPLPKSLMKGVRQDSLAFVQRIKCCINEMEPDLEDEITREDIQDFCKLPLA
jgi:hypothetical protein